MNRYDWLDAYLLDKPGVEKDYKVEWGWFRYKVGGKMYAATCQPDPKYGYGGREMVTLRADPLEAELLRREYEDIFPGFYSDKQRWNSVFLDGEVPDELLRRLCDTAYDIIFFKLTKKLQKEILEGNEG